MANIGYPYTYGDVRDVNYEIELVNKTVDFLKGIIQKTYRITQVISKCGVVQKVTIGFVIFVFALGLRFGSLRPVEPIIQPQTQIERQLQHSSSVRNLLEISGGDLDKASSPGARARSDARQAMTNRSKGANSKPGGSGFAEAWSSNPSKRSRPAAANTLAQQFQPGPAEGGNGLFSARPTPDPSNPGCAGGPRSITVLSSQDKKWEKLSAEEKYDSIRKSKADVDAIAKNTGCKRKNVQNCKNHLFYDNHRLDRYESLGEPVEIKRFDANENQARAWKRLEKGTHTTQDLTWLKHEKAEQWYEQKHDAGYSESHEAAEKHWSGTPWTNTNTNTKDKE